jgi:aldehyde dehydrogenase (NAD+)
LFSVKKGAQLTDISKQLITLGKKWKERKYTLLLTGREYSLPQAKHWISDVKPDDPMMKEEIFGPVLPVLEFDDFSEVYGIIERNPKPLATYIFSRDRRLIREFLSRTQAGTASVNDTVMQIASPYLPYEGVGSSGIGRYRGKRSFDTFSNHRSVLVKSNLLDMPVRYPPYTDLKTKIVSFLLR